QNSALRRKLQSKSEALLILSKDLDQCRTERDQFKLMAEQLQDRYSMLKKKSHDMVNRRCGKSLAQVLGESTEQNKALRIELEDLRQKLRDAHGDIKILLLEIITSNPDVIILMPVVYEAECNLNLIWDEMIFMFFFICQVSNCVVLQCTQMRTDLQAVLDEKEELVTERDAYKCKVHRLNHELNALLKGDSKKLVDVDSLVMENRYLKERLQQAEEEKDMSNQALSKYKSMLDKKRSKGTVKLGTNNTGMVMSHKQVQQLLERGTSAQLPNTAATLSDLKSLCLALLEALGDKVLALAHQKKANR
ncbi:hypothetical protein L798_00581, partial [Zootermopsis nevadensis]